MPRKYLPWLVALGFALLFLSTFFTKNQQLQIGTTPQPSTQATPSAQEKYTFLVTRVIDGDTIEVNGKTKVRYIGIDTPEPGDCFGQEAKEANERLVGNKSIKLEYDLQRLDKYGRTLAYVYADNLFVNEKLVLEGFAKVSTFPPNILHVNKFIEAERSARENKLGLWSPNVCTTINTQLDQDVGKVLSTSTNQSGCVIKGNINTKGEKIYHIPGQRFYAKTQIDESAGERWFCSESEAEVGGWRKSKV